MTTRRGTATFTVKLTRAIREDTVFVPFHWGGEQSANRLTNAALDPISRMPEFKVCAVRATAPRPDPNGDGASVTVHGTRWSSSATAWPARASSRTCSRAGGGQLFDIAVFGDEPHGNYNRILLSGVLAGTTARTTSSSTRCRGTPRTASRCMPASASNGSISPAKRVTAGDGIVEPYDALVIATGSRPLLPPIDGLCPTDGGG